MSRQVFPKHSPGVAWKRLHGQNWRKNREAGETPHLSFFSGLLYTALVAIPGISVNWRKPRRTASRPGELRWSGPAEPGAAVQPLLAAFATIAAMIKCFNSIKNCYHPRMTTNTPPTSGVQLIEVAPELPANASTISSSRLKGVPKTLIYRILRKAKCG
jgi:hypothetical protein